MSEKTCKKELYDFLMYSVFGIVDKDNKYDKKIKCAYRAYRDLARTLRYKYTSSELEHAKKGSKEGDFKEKRDSWIREMCTELINSIDMFEKEKKEFDIWHKELCAKFVEPTEEDQVFCRGKEFLEKGFTYGQAQKWLNMTLKYLWLMDLLPTSISPEWLHVPIDSYILKKLKREDSFKECDDIKSDQYLNETWSAFSNYDNYKELQERIRDMLKEEAEAPIEWEGTAWIEIANNGNGDMSNGK